MRSLTQDEIVSVSGAYDIVYVAANASDPYAGTNIATLVSQLVNHQMDPNQFLQDVANSGIQLTQFMYFSGQNPPPLPCPPNCP